MPADETATARSSPGDAAEPRAAGAVAESRPSRYLTPPPRPRTFRLRPGLRAWERDGRRNLADARKGFWSQAETIRQQQEETRQRLRPDAIGTEAAAAEAGNPEP